MVRVLQNEVPWEHHVTLWLGENTPSVNQENEICVSDHSWLGEGRGQGGEKIPMFHLWPVIQNQERFHDPHP